MPYQDKLGVYRVGDLKFHSKLEAIEMHMKTGIHPTWDFNEAVFSSCDWTREPVTSLPELYKQRAQQLRNDYDYIIVMYSGGADSANVLESFLHNDIKVDEVCSYSNFQTTGVRNNALNAEVANVSIPYIQQLQEQYPWLKYKLLNILELELDYFNDCNNIGWIYEMNMYFSPNNASRASLPMHVKEWRDIIESGKKLAVVWGKDKPRVYQIGGKFAARFIDLIDDAATVKSIAGNEPYANEFFYWTPDKPEIIIKQAHLIKNYMQALTPQKLPFVSLKKSNFASIEYQGQLWYLSNNGVHSIIYPNWNVGTFTFVKSPSTMWSLKDKWFYSLEDEHSAKKIFYTGLEKLWKTLPDYWKNDPSDWSKGIKSCWSKSYFLEEIK
jgi:hypothetical protein